MNTSSKSAPEKRCSNARVWSSATISPRCSIARRVHQRLRNQYAPFHTAGERAHICIRFVRKTEVGEYLIDPIVFAQQAIVTGLDAQGLPHRKKRVKHQFLRYNAEHAARGAKVRKGIAPANPDPAAIGAR